MGFRPSSKILLLNSMEKVLVLFSTFMGLCYVLLKLIIFSASITSCVVLGVWDAEGRQEKTGAESAAVHGSEINTAFDLYTSLKQHHSQVTNTYHEALHQVDNHEFHYFPVGLSWHTILASEHSFVHTALNQVNN